MLGALRIRDFRLLLAGQLLSNVGDWLLLVAAPFFVFELTGSTMATGLTLTAEAVPAIVLGPVAGVFVDRWDRRRTMIATDVLRAATVLSMLAVHSRGEVWIVYGAVTVEAGFSQFFSPARRALVPNLVGRGPELSAANAVSQLVEGVIRLVGGPLGGVLYVFFGFRSVVVLDVASYVLSAGLTLLVRHRVLPSKATRRDGAGTRPAPRRFRAESRAGLGHVYRNPDLRTLFVVAGLFTAPIRSRPDLKPDHWSTTAAIANATIANANPSLNSLLSITRCATDTARRHPDAEGAGAATDSGNAACGAAGSAASVLGASGMRRAYPAAKTPSHGLGPRLILGRTFLAEERLRPHE